AKLGLPPSHVVGGVDQGGFDSGAGECRRQIHTHRLGSMGPDTGPDHGDHELVFFRSGTNRRAHQLNGGLPLSGTGLEIPRNAVAWPSLYGGEEEYWMRVARRPHVVVQPFGDNQHSGVQEGADVTRAHISYLDRVLRLRLFQGRDCALKWEFSEVGPVD